MEILDHAGGAVDLSRLNTVGVVLFNHDPDKVVGKVIRAYPLCFVFHALTSILFLLI